MTPKNAQSYAALEKRPMKALLLYPEVPETLWSLTHALRIMGKKTSSPPLGLLTVAAMLPPETERKVIDLNAEQLEDSVIQWADIVFISAMLIQRDSSRTLINRVKQFGKPIVAGGPLFTGCPEDYDDVDHLVLNEAELTFPPFLKDLAAGRPRHLYQTVEFADMALSPLPAYNLIDPIPYAVMGLQYSRGCPHRCEFCNVTTLFGHRPRTKTADQIIVELDTLYHVGWRGTILFVDDNLLCNQVYLKHTLLPAIIQWKKNKPAISFDTQVTMSLADDPELVALMRDAGFDTVFIGIETIEEESLAECKKGQNLRRNMLEQVQFLHKNGILVKAGFIVGFDHDKPTIFERQFNFIQETGIALAMIGILQAPLQTPLYERMKKEGRLKEGLFAADSVVGDINFVPKMDQVLLVKGYKKLVHDLYEPNNYYRRLRHFLGQFKASPESPPLNKEGLGIMLRCFLWLGVLKPGRLRFWQSLVWTVCRKRGAFRYFMILALFGYHFRTVFLNIHGISQKSLPSDQAPNNE